MEDQLLRQIARIESAIPGALFEAIQHREQTNAATRFGLAIFVDEGMVDSAFAVTPTVS